MNAQFKKGILDLIILQILSKRAMTTYDVLIRLRDAMHVNENTVYPILRRLEEDLLIYHEKEKGDMGAPRKIFLLTEKGKKQLENLHKEWDYFANQVNYILGDNDDE